MRKLKIEHLKQEYDDRTSFRKALGSIIILRVCINHELLQIQPFLIISRLNYGKQKLVRENWPWLKLLKLNSASQGKVISKNKRKILSVSQKFEHENHPSLYARLQCC